MEDDRRIEAGAELLRAFVLRGEPSLVAAAVDWLHVRVDVRGVVEADGLTTVWLTTALPQLPMPEIAVEELGAGAANATATGFENDRAILVAEDLLVRPPWVERPAGFAGIDLVVPRGMAFGSGEHDSTRAALLAMHAAYDAPASFCDVGTGSGILLAYAAARGCARMCACDIEEPAVAAARELVPAAEIVLGGPAVLPFAADFMVANMTGKELAATLGDILSHWTQLAPLVLSGMREHEVEAIRGRLPAPAEESASGEFRALVCHGARRAKLMP